MDNRDIDPQMLRLPEEVKICKRCVMSNQRPRITFDENGVTSLDWDTYPILRFPDAPIIETVILDRPGYPFLGAGEASSGPVAAAIANAVFDAAGKRLREIPFNPL